MLVIGCRLGEITTLRLDDPGGRDALGARRHRAGVDRGRPAAAGDDRHRRRAPVPSRGRRRASSPAACSTPRPPTPGRRGTPRTAPPGRPPPSSTTHAWTGPGVHPGKRRHLAAPAPARRRDRHDGRRQLRDVGGAGLPLPAAGDVPRLRPPARWATACPPRSRPASSTATATVVALVGDGGLGMTLAEIETAVRMGLRTIVLVFDNQRYGMIRSYQDRRSAGRARSDRPRADRLRGRGPGARGARRSGRGRRGVRAGAPAGPRRGPAERCCTSSSTAAGRVSTAGRERVPRSVRRPRRVSSRHGAPDPSRVRRARAAIPPGPRRTARAGRHARPNEAWEVLKDAARRASYDTATRRPARLPTRPFPSDCQRRPGPAVLDRRHGTAPGASVRIRARLRHLRRLVHRRDRAARPGLPRVAARSSPRRRPSGPRSRVCSTRTRTSRGAASRRGAQARFFRRALGAGSRRRQTPRRAFRRPSSPALRRRLRGARLGVEDLLEDLAHARAHQVPGAAASASRSRRRMRAASRASRSAGPDRRDRRPRPDRPPPGRPRQPAGGRLRHAASQACRAGLAGCPEARARRHLPERGRAVHGRGLVQRLAAARRRADRRARPAARSGSVATLDIAEAAIAPARSGPPAPTSDSPTRAAKHAAAPRPRTHARGRHGVGAERGPATAPGAKAVPPQSRDHS